MSSEKKPKAHVAEYKKKIVDSLAKDIVDYPIIGAINMENLPATQLQLMMISLRGKLKMVMTKRRLMKIAIEKAKSKKDISSMIPHLQGMPALIFTKENPFSLFKTLKKNKTAAPAKAGQVAPRDCIVPAGPTPFAPGPVISELASVGIKTGVENGKVAVKVDTVVVKEGAVITPKQAEILTKFNIKPMEIGLNLVAVFENGEILTKSILDIDEDKFMADLKNCARWAFNLSVEAGYTNKDNIEFLVGKAFRDSKSLAIAQTILADKVIEIIVGKAEREALAVKAAGNIATEAYQKKNLIDPSNELESKSEHVPKERSLKKEEKMEPTAEDMIDEIKKRDEAIIQSPDVQAEIERKKAEDVAKQVLKKGTARDMGTTAPPLPASQPKKKKEDSSEYDKMSQVAQQVLRKGTSR